MVTDRVYARWHEPQIRLTPCFQALQWVKFGAILFGISHPPGRPAMPRLRFRLRTLALLIAIIALALALLPRDRVEELPQVRPNSDEERRLKEFEAQNLRELKAILEKRGFQVVHPPGNDRDAGQDRPIDQGEVVGPQH